MRFLAASCLRGRSPPWNVRKFSVARSFCWMSVKVSERKRESLKKIDWKYETLIAVPLRVM